MRPRSFIHACCVLVCAIAGTECSTISVARAGALELADTSATAGRGGASDVSSVSPPASSQEKSGQTAFLASFLTTGILGGAALIVKESTGDQDHSSDIGTTTALGITAYLAGPSIGHFYAGQSRRAWAGIGVRGLIGLGFAAALATGIDEDPSNDQEALAVAIVAVAAGAVVFDIATAPRSARIHNEKVRRVSIRPASVGGAPGMRVDVGL